MLPTMGHSTMKANKRLRKQKLLLQIAILGLIAWSIILLFDHAINDYTNSTYQDPSKQSQFIALSDLQVLKNDTVMHHPLEKDTKEHTRELRLRLQKLRMHNVLRTSNSSQSLITANSAKVENKRQASSINSEGSSNLQRVLVQKWEKEFLAL